MASDSAVVTQVSPAPAIVPRPVRSHPNPPRQQSHQTSILHLATIGVCAVITVAVLVSLSWMPMTGIRWKPNTTDAFLQTFAALGLVAIFVERVVEVFVAIWQDPRVDLLEQQIEFHQAVQVDRRKDIQELEAKLTIPNQDPTCLAHLRESIHRKERELEEAEEEAEVNEKNMVTYRAQTRRLAAWIGIVIGILTAAVGFRILYNLVDVEAIQPTGRVAGAQYRWFVIIDTLLTGAVLAGGSKAVHEVFNLYSAVMESSQSILQKRKLQQATPPVPPATPVA